MAWPACSGEPGQIQAWKRANVPGPDEKCRDDAGGAEQIDHADVVVGSITWRPVRLLAGIDVSVALNTTTYQPAPLMPRQEYTSSGDQLQDAAALVTLEQIASLFLKPDPVAVSNIEQAVARGIAPDAYDVQRRDTPAVRRHN